MTKTAGELKNAAIFTSRPVDSDQKKGQIRRRQTERTGATLESLQSKSRYNFHCSSFPPSLLLLSASALAREREGLKANSTT